MHIDETLAAVVTGGASGLGAATVRALRAGGAKVAIFDMNEAAGQAMAAETGAFFVKVDVTDGASVEAGLEAARAQHGQERVLACCAGIVSAVKTASRSRETGEAKHFPLDVFARTIQVNLIGTFHCVAKSAAGMLNLAPLEDGERGCIIMTASVAAQDGQIGQAAYSASKGGVMAMTLPIARDLAAEGIRVNTILPGIFSTPMMASMPASVQEALGASVPFPKRLGDPAEYAALALFMIQHRYLNGESIRLDGAIRLAPK